MPGTSYGPMVAGEGPVASGPVTPGTVEETVVSPTPGRLEGRASRPSAPAINRNDRSELEPTAYYPDITKARSEVGFAQLPETAYPSEIQAGQKGNHDNDQEEHIGGGRGMSVADE